jgi:hypothetical protein
VSFSVKVKNGFVTFDVRYEGHRTPTDVHVHVGGRDGPALIGYDHIPDDLNARRGFELQVSEGNPNLPRTEDGHLRWETSFTLVWTFSDSPHEEIDPDHPVYPSMAEKIAALLEALGKAVGRGRCFIATAAFGSPLEIEVLRLQLWRERVLRPTVVGRAVIALYSLVSPPLARLIERRREGILGSLVRFALRRFLLLVDRMR